MWSASRGRGIDALQRARLTTVVCACLALVVTLAPYRAGASPDFRVPPALRPTVNFWIDVFAKYGRHQIVIHDTERVDRVYSVLDFRALERQGQSDVQIELAMKSAEENEKARVRGILRRLDQLDPSTDYLTEEEERIYGLFGNDRSPSKFRDAAGPDRIRGQKGIRERFALGIQTGHAYFPHMEAIFRQAGVPTEITRLPLVESCFNMRAYSKVGAAGVWQFMPGTARSFMRIDGAVDERLDPLVASRAAARFMRQNYEKLGSWPLAINAYNHGPAGMARAVSTTGTTDITRIIQSYRGPAYKFASRNFYPEFLAAIEVEANHRKYFGELPLHPPFATDTVYLAQRTHIGSAARCAGADVFEIAQLNPSLLPVVHQGRAQIPPGFELRVPVGSADRFDRCAATTAPPREIARRPSSGRGGRASVSRGGKTVKTGSRHVVHKVKPGQTLSQIAAQYGSTVDRIRRGNRLKSNKIHSGQVLRIPLS